MRLKFLPIALLAVVGIGCQPGLSEKDFVGNWTSKITISDANLLKQIKTMGGSEKDLPQAKKMLGDLKMQLDLKEDKTYTMGQGAGLIEGTWTFAAPKLTLKPVKMGGMKVEDVIKQAPQAKAQADPLVLDVDKEGKTLTGTSQDATMSFTKTAPEAKK